MRQWIKLFENALPDHPYIAEWNAWAAARGASVDLKTDPTRPEWETKDWRVTLELRGDDRIELTYIKVHEWAQRKGVANEILTVLCGLADKYNVKMQLVSDETNDAVGDDDEDDDFESDYDEREHWLQTWYSRFGFDYTGDTSDYGPWMERQPQ